MGNYKTKFLVYFAEIGSVTRSVDCNEIDRTEEVE